jgi:hypothetical protein
MARCGGEIGAYTTQPNFHRWENLDHYHLQDIAGKHYDMSLVAIGLSQQHARLHDPNR